MIADDNYTIKWHQNIEIMIANLENSLSTIVKWLTDSGLKVNDEKTEICLFSRQNVRPVRVLFCGKTVLTKPEMNVLGIVFDSKLKWGPQVTSALSKSSNKTN